MQVGGVKVKINSLGFRDNEFSLKKDNKFRIIVLGDSCTAGFEVNLEDTYSKQLENILNIEKRLKYYEVINAGIPGYTSFQGERYFSIITKEFKPDLVVVFFGTNDGGLAKYPDKNLTFLRLVKMSFMRNICIKSKLAQLVLYKIYKNQENKWYIRVSPEDFRKNLERIDNSGTRDGVKILFVKPCLRREVEKGTSDNNYVPPEPYIDLFELFKGYKDNPDEIFVDYKHFTVLGHKILAQEIYKHLAVLFPKAVSNKIP